jgi:hypothetical protein
VVVEAGVIVGYVIAWLSRKAQRAGGRLDGEVDAAMDAGLDRLHQVVAKKLGNDPALTDLDDEATTGEPVSELTRQRVELSVQAAAGRDQGFAQAVAALVEQVRKAEAEQAGGRAAAIGQDAVAVAGDVEIRAESGSAAAWQMGNVQIGHPAGSSGNQAGTPPTDPR